MKVLGIETSCDETSVALVEDGRLVLAEKTISQIPLHRTYGGVVPELAAREHALYIDQVIWDCLEEAGLNWSGVDRIAVVNGPGLVSSLMTGITAAKFLSLALGKELVAVNHLKAHIAAVMLKEPELEPPFVCLLASGGHTQLLWVKDFAHTERIERLGQTLDDSAGEAFDKVARMLGLSYPGGPAIERLAQGGDRNAYRLPRPKLANQFDFSFSGLKTAVIRLIESLPEDFCRKDLAASFQENVCLELSEKLVSAAKYSSLDKLVIAGGVAANQRLREMLAIRPNYRLFAPDLKHCTDNGAMVAAAGFWCPIYSGLNFGVFAREK
ncbi:MAG: tRNA (adenosine(37)-N6)-threonylcarbamoyltransferase complex transferase subunit TsaD [Candidatus Caenarcaniphilales bacterium]|nr:tRNA (adenosine(37)-N6)-threonylcarbamoyltransferase complex transferase subunit TsaD [Candidatus Caenarcaniphilales bacterium]